MNALVYVVEPDGASRSEIGPLLEARGYQTVACRTAEEILRERPDSGRAGCIVVNVRTRDPASPELCDWLARAAARFPIIIVAGNGDARAGVRAIKAGAEDFFTRPLDSDEFIFAIDSAIARQRIAAARESSERMLFARLQRLTPRERQVFEFVYRGRLNKQIAYDLGLTERTVKAHRHQMMEKLQLHSMVELLSFAQRLGLSPASN